MRQQRKGHSDDGAAAAHASPFLLSPEGPKLGHFAQKRCKIAQSRYDWR
jgi:hypothetical protein